MKLKIQLIRVLVLTINLIFVNQVKAQPTLFEQVNQVADFFTGLFDNRNQVLANPDVDILYLTMANCSVNLTGSGNISATRPIYLEQRIGGFEQTNPLLRSRFYGFNRGNDVVDLSIYRFVEEDLVLGLCNQPESEREIAIDNIINNSCDLSLIWQSESFYRADNTPVGCPTANGGKVISEVEISPDLVFSLDRFFAADGSFLFGTPIKFERITAESVPEGDFRVSFFFLGLIGFRLLEKEKQE